MRPAQDGRRCCDGQGGLPPETSPFTVSICHRDGDIDAATLRSAHMAARCRSAGNAEGEAALGRLPSRSSVYGCDVAVASPTTTDGTRVVSLRMNWIDCGNAVGFTRTQVDSTAWVMNQE